MRKLVSATFNAECILSFLKKNHKIFFTPLSVSRYCLLKSAAAAVRAAFTVDLLITFNCF